MHTHVTQIEWAPVYLAAGVTTVRDMGNEFEFIMPLRDAIASTRALGPRMLAAGLIDGGGPNAFGVVLRGDAGGSEAGGREISRRRLPADQDLQPGHAADRRGDLRRGAPARHDRHRPHAQRHDDRAGRGRRAWITSRTSPIRGEAGSDEVKKTIAFLRDHKTVIDPTQSWNELLGHAVGTPIAAFQPGVLKIPAPLNRVFSNAGAAGIDAATARTRLERGLRIVKALHDAGVPIVAGTDEGIPGHSVHREIELYVEAGLTPMEALQAATIVSARAMKMDAELGTIERGKRADMVVLNANPLDAIRNIRSVRWTISDGRVYDAAALWQSVRFQP